GRLTHGKMEPMLIALCAVVGALFIMIEGVIIAYCCTNRNKEQSAQAQSPRTMQTEESSGPTSGMPTSSVQVFGYGPRSNSTFWQYSPNR
ncbi:hypothetical protein PENTCL1PPCAC_23503, partial [Pristionchus entomophagus]